MNLHKIFLLILIFLMAIPLAARTLEYDYTRINVPDNWSPINPKILHADQNSFQSTSGIVLQFSNMGYDAPEIKDAREFHNIGDGQKYTSGKSQTGIDYKVYVLSSNNTNSNSLLVLFYGFRYQGPEKTPLPVSNALYFGSNDSSDRPLLKNKEIQSILKSITVKPYRRVTYKKITHPTDKYIFRVPKDWLMAPVLALFPEIQTISPRGPYLYTWKIWRIRMNHVTAQLKNNFLMLSGSRLNTPQRYTNTHGLVMQIYHGTTYTPYASNFSTHLTVIAFPLNNDKVILLVMVGSLTDPVGLQKIADSIQLP